MIPNQLLIDLSISVLTKGKSMVNFKRYNPETTSFTSDTYLRMYLDGQLELKEFDSFYKKEEI